MISSYLFSSSAVPHNYYIYSQQNQSLPDQSVLYFCFESLCQFLFHYMKHKKCCILDSESHTFYNHLCALVTHL